MDHRLSTLIETELPDNSADLCEQTGKAIYERCRAHAVMAEVLTGCSTALSQAAGMLTEALRAGRRVFTCGNGGSASEAQHFAAELVGRFRLERNAFPATALTADASTMTAIANDYGYEHTFSRQIEGLAGPGDVLVAFSTSGRSMNVIQAAMTAREQGVGVVAVTGGTPNDLARLADVALVVPSSDTPTIQEFHMLFTHILCGVVEDAMAPERLGGRV